MLFLKPAQADNATATCRRWKQEKKQQQYYCCHVGRYRDDETKHQTKLFSTSWSLFVKANVG